MKLPSPLFGVIGGPGSSATDFHAVLRQAALAAGFKAPEIVTVTLAAGEGATDGVRHRKMRLFEAVRAFERRGAAAFQRMAARTRRHHGHGAHSRFLGGA